MEFLGGLVIGAFVVYAAWQTITNGKTPGEFTAFITAFLMAYQPAEKVSKYWVELQRSLVQTGNMYEILDAPAALIADGTISKSDLGSGLALNNVGFSYDGAKPRFRMCHWILQAAKFWVLLGVRVRVNQR